MAIHGIKEGALQEIKPSEVDLEIPTTNQLFGSHINLIPLQNNVQCPRLFYGARFYNQAMPLKHAEAPLIQALVDGDEKHRSFDEYYGQQAGAVFSDADGKVSKITPDEIHYTTHDGHKRKLPLYNGFVFNRKTAITNYPVVKEGDAIKAGQVLARSDFTDDKGTLALGTNARVALIPYKGHSMDDAVNISEAFAKKLTSIHTSMHTQDFDQDVKGGLHHYISLFPTSFTKDQLANIDEHGVVKPGTVLKEGDPMILASRPRVISSTSAALGKLSKSMREARSDAAQVWEHEEPGVVKDVAHTRHGVKVVIASERPAKKGDKIVTRHGQKGVISLVIPDEHMPRTVDGQPVDVLLNSMGMPSRVNDATPYEIMLGQLATKLGHPIKVPSFNGIDKKRYAEIEEMLQKNGLKPEQDLYDPLTHKKLDEPVTVGNAYIMKLHHVAESKQSARGTGAYDCFDSETEVLTRRGWVAWPAVTEDDELFTPEEDGASGVYEKPQRLVSYEFDGELHRYESRFLDWAVTDKHEFLTKSPKGKWTKHTADKLRALPSRRVPQFGVKLADAGNPTTKTFPADLSKRRLVRNTEPLTISFEDYARLTAWWLSEGYVKSAEDRLHICQNKKANPAKWQEIWELMNRVTPNAVHNHNDVEIRTDDPRLVAFYRNYGTSCYDKRVPEDLIFASPEMVHVFFETFVKGDGHHHESVKTDGRMAVNVTDAVGSASRLMMDDFQRMAIHAGGGLIPRRVYTTGEITTLPGGRQSVRSDFWAGALQFTRTVASVVREGGAPRYTGKWGRVPYRGKVYCATTRTGLLYVRRNGKPVVTGNSNQQPLKGGSEAAQSKRLSMLEGHALMSAGAYNTLRESATLRGQRNDEYWRALRSGYTPKNPGRPFIYDKFLTLLSGAGLHARQIDKERLRLGPFTDKDLDEQKPFVIKNSEIVDTRNLNPVPGGLFDPALVAGNKWGRIDLPFPVVVPSFEHAALHLLGLTEKQYREILAGRAELPEELR